MATPFPCHSTHTTPIYCMIQVKWLCICLRASRVVMTTMVLRWWWWWYCGNFTTRLILHGHCCYDMRQSIHFTNQCPLSLSATESRLVGGSYVRSADSVSHSSFIPHWFDCSPFLMRNFYITVMPPHFFLLFFGIMYDVFFACFLWPLPHSAHFLMVCCCHVYRPLSRRSTCQKKKTQEKNQIIKTSLVVFFFFWGKCHHIALHF